MDGWIGGLYFNLKRNKGLRHNFVYLPSRAVDLLRFLEFEYEVGNVCKLVFVQEFNSFVSFALYVRPLIEMQFKSLTKDLFLIRKGNKK